LLHTGPDPNDPWTLAQPAALPDYTERLNADALRGIRIGMPRNAPTYPGTYGGEVHPLILRALNHSVVAFKRLGAVIVDSDFDDTVFEILKNTSSTARVRSFHP
jgi:amidase